MDVKVSSQKFSTKIKKGFKKKTGKILLHNRTTGGNMLEQGNTESSVAVILKGSALWKKTPARCVKLMLKRRTI